MFLYLFTYELKTIDRREISLNEPKILALFIFRSYAIFLYKNVNNKKTSIPNQNSSLVFCSISSRFMKLSTLEALASLMK